jgi:uncharacterized membrane protein
MSIGNGIIAGTSSSLVFESFPLAGKRGFNIQAVAYVETGSTAASIAIIRPSRQKGQADGLLTIPANAEITRVAFKLTGNVTLGAATGKLKLATALNASSADLFVESAAASGGTLAAAGWVTRDNPLDATTTVGSSAVTYRLYATDGAAGASAAASTVTASKRTKVLVQVCGYIPGINPTDESFPDVITEIFTDG